jgi:hypothetical protein
MLLTVLLALVALAAAACGDGSPEPALELRFDFEQGTCPAPVPRLDLEVGRPVDITVSAGTEAREYMLVLRLPASGVETTRPVQEGAAPGVDSTPVSVQLGAGEVGMLSFTPDEAGEFRSECAVSGFLNLAQGSVVVHQ